MALLLISHDLGVMARTRAAPARDVRRHGGRERARPAAVFARLAHPVHARRCSARGRASALRARQRGWRRSRAACRSWPTCRAGCPFADRCALASIDACRARRRRASPVARAAAPTRSRRRAASGWPSRPRGRSAAAATRVAHERDLRRCCEVAAPRQALPAAARAPARRRRRACRRCDGVSFTLQAGAQPRHRRRIGLGQVDAGAAGDGARARRPRAACCCDGRDLHALAPRRAARARARDFQMVFQDPYGSLDPRQRVGRIVAEPLARARRGAREQRAARRPRSLDAVGLRAADARQVPARVLAAASASASRSRAR